MISGISKETLKNVCAEYLETEDYLNNMDEVHDLINLLFKSCTELDPWIPIDDNTPRDRPLLLRVRGHAIEGIRIYGTNGWMTWPGREEIKPTHYKLLE